MFGAVLEPMVSCIGDALLLLPTVTVAHSSSSLGLNAHNGLERERALLAFLDRQQQQEGGTAGPGGGEAPMGQIRPARPARLALALVLCWPHPPVTALTSDVGFVKPIQGLHSALFKFGTEGKPRWNWSTQELSLGAPGWR